MKGIVLAMIFLGVLIVVGWSADAKVTKLEATIQQMMDQRTDTVAIAGEAKAQRDIAFAQLKDVKDQLATLQDSLDKKTAEVENLARERDAALKSAGDQQQEAARLTNEVSRLQANVDELTARYNQLNGKYIALQQAYEKVVDKSIPVTSAQAPAPVNPMASVLIVMAGIMALGSGGFIVYRMEENSKVQVRMTREQIKEFARYQRERGNRAD